jgi:sRNA-binding carbon storage regulator CsrA
MLTLTRKNGAKTFLDLPNGERITIVIWEADAGYCRLGIDAPKSVRIVRDDAVNTNPKPPETTPDWKRIIEEDR